MAYKEFTGQLDSETSGGFQEFTGELDAVSGPLPEGMAPSKAGGGRGTAYDPRRVDNPDGPQGMEVESAAPDGFVTRAVKAVQSILPKETAYKSVLEDRPPTPQDDTARPARTLSYGAGPISQDTVREAASVRELGTQPSSTLVQKTAQGMAEANAPTTETQAQDSFGTKNRLATKRKAEEFRDVGQWANDSVSSLMQGGLSLAQMPLAIVSPTSALYGDIDSAQKFLQANESSILKASRSDMASNAQSAEGFQAKYASVVSDLVSNPTLAISETIKQLPNLLAIVGLAKGGMVVAGAGVRAAESASPAFMLANAISGGGMGAAAVAAGGTAGGLAGSVGLTAGDAAQGAFETLVNKPREFWAQNPDYQKLRKAGSSHSDAVGEIATARARVAALYAAPLGLLGYMGAEASIVGGMAGRAVRRDALAPLKVFGKELAGEQIEEGGTPVASNYAVSSVDPSQDLMQGVPEGMATALVTSSPFAAYAAMGESKRQAALGEPPAPAPGQPPAPPPTPPAPPPDRSAQINALRTAGDKTAADLLQRRQDREQSAFNAERETQALQNFGPELQQRYREIRLSGVMPGDAVTQTAMQFTFEQAARAAGLSDKARAATLAKAAAMDPEKAPAFLQRALQALTENGLAQPVENAHQLAATIEEQRDRLLDAVLAGDIRPTMTEIEELDQAADPAVPLATDGEAQTFVPFDGSLDDTNQSSDVAPSQPAAATQTQAAPGQVPIAATGDAAATQGLPDARGTGDVQADGVIDPRQAATAAARQVLDAGGTDADANRAATDALIAGMATDPGISMATEAPAVVQAARTPAASLTRSADIEAAPAVVLQNRDRSSAASVAQMNEIAANPDYMRAGQANVMDTGAPVVFGDMPPTAAIGRAAKVVDGKGKRDNVKYVVVEAANLLTSNSADGTRVPEYEQGQPGKLRTVAGNGRAAGVTEAYNRGTAEQYRADLIEDAQTLGIDSATIEAMRAPVLVRVMASQDVTPDIADRSNIAGTARLSAVEQASTDARRIDLSALAFDDQGNPTANSVRQFTAGMPTSERSEMLNADGTATRQAVDRLMAATFKQAYGSDDLVQIYAQATDPEARTVMTALADAAGAMAGLSDAGELDIRGAVAEAAGIAVNAARQGVKLADFLKNGDMTTSGEAFVIARFFAQNSRSAKRIAEGLRDWANYAAAQAQIARDNETQDGMFGATPVATRADVFRRLENGQPTQEDIGQPARVGDAGRGSQRAQDDPGAGQAGARAGAAKATATAGSQAQGVAPAFPATLRADGTLAVRGDTAQIKQRLSEAGIPARSILPSATGALVGKTQAVRAQDVLNAQPEQGAFGPIFTQYRGDAQGAIQALTKLQNGEATAALNHPEVGDIDLVWGETSDSPRSTGFGLAKLKRWHPEVLNDLQGFISRLSVKQKHKNKIHLQDDAGGRASVQLDWDGDRKVWLLTAYEKSAGKGTSADTAQSSARDDTARPDTSTSSVAPTAEQDNTDALTAPTRADIEAQQDRAEQADQLDAKAQIDKERDAADQTTGVLQRQTAPEQRRDSSGDMFAMEKAQAEVEQRNAGRARDADPNQGGLNFSRKAVDSAATTTKPQTETEAFKAWFGDWQAAAAQKRLDTMEPVVVRIPPDWRGLTTADLRVKVQDALLSLMQSGEPLRHPEIGEVSVVRKGIKKALSSSADPAKLLTLGDLRAAFEGSFLAGTQPAVNDAPNIEAYEKLLARLTVDGTDVVAVFSVQKLADGRQFYNAVTLEDAKSKTPVASPRDTPIAGERAASANTGVSSFVRRVLGRVNPDAVSKAVDAEGKPLVMYHGTSASKAGDAFTQFNTYSTGNSLMGNGAYFTADPAVASSYTTKGRGDSPSVYPVYLSIQNPLDMDAKADPAQWTQQFPDVGLLHEGGTTNESWYRAARDMMAADGMARWEADEIIQNRMRDMGFDGITHIGGGRVKNDGVKHRVFIAFDDVQVKSATGNNGQFDPSNPDIRHARTFDVDLFRQMTTPMARGMKVAEVEQAIAPVLKRWTNGPEVTVVATVNDLPITAPSDVAGFYLNGRAYLVAANLRDKGAAMRYLGHEVIAHHGLRTMLGEQGFRQFTNQVQLALKTGNKPLAAIRAEVRAAYVDDKGNFNLTPAQESDEIAAKVVEQAIDAEGSLRPGFGFVKAVYAKIAEFLRSVGLPVTFTMPELQGMLVNAQRMLEAGQRTNGAQQAKRPVFARTDMPSNGNALQALSEMDDLFALPKSTKTDLQGIADDNVKGISIRTTKLPGGETMHTLTLPDGSVARITVRESTPKSVYSAKDDGDGGHDWVQGRPGENPQDVKPDVQDVWLDVSNLTAGNNGALAYNIAATFAHNTGRIFIGDPNGLSKVALRRRLEQMISSALKFGTTAHLAPHPDQVAGGDGVPGLRWVYGDDVGNVERMVAASVKALDNAFPQSKMIEYRDDGNFYNATTGVLIPRGELAVGLRQSIAEQRDLRGEAESTGQAGWRTVARGALLRHFGKALEVEPASSDGRGLLDRLGSDVSRLRRDPATGQPYEAKERILYARTGGHAESVRTRILEEGRLGRQRQDSGSAGRLSSGAFARPTPPANGQQGIPADGTLAELPAVPGETKARYVQRRVQDQFNRFTVIRNWAKEQGMNLSQLSNVYGFEERMHGKIAARVEDFRELRVAPLVQRIQKAGFTMADVGQFLHAQHATERNKQIASIDPTNVAGSGMTNQAAAAVLASADPRLKALANEFRSIADDTKRALLDGGIISADTVQAWEGAYQHYVPLKGGDDAVANVGTGKGLSVKATNKRAMGHSERPEFIVENILRDFERAVMLDEKNIVGQSLLAFVIELGRPDIATFGQPAKRKVLKSKTDYIVIDANGNTLGQFDSQQGANAFILTQPAAGLTVRAVKGDPMVAYMASPQLAENEVQVYARGQTIRIQLNDLLLAQAYKRQGIEQLGMLMQANREINAFLSKAYTGYNPEFFFVNVQRDFSSGLINITGHEGVGVAAKSMARYPKAFAQMLKYRYTGVASDSIKAYRASGGSTGAAYLGDLERVGADIENAYNEYKGVIALMREGKPTKASTVAVKKLVKALVTWIEHLNAAGENAMRLAVFEVIRQTPGRSVQEAASMAKNSTVNFNRKGEMGAQASALYLFFNAAVQGTAGMMEALFMGKHKHQAQALALALGGLAYALVSLQFGGDDDEDDEGRKAWEKIPSHVRDRNMIIRTGADSYITIAVPYGYGFMFAAGNAAYDLQHGADKDKVALRLASGFVEHFGPAINPLSGGELTSQNMVELVPGLFGGELMRAGARLVANRSGLGGQIVPESPFDEGKPDNLRSFRSSKGTVYEAVAQGLNATTGGTPSQSGMIDVSPETLKFWMQTITGGSGKFVMDTATAATLMANKLTEKNPEARDALTPELRELPIVRKLARKEDIRDARSLYWEHVRGAQDAIKDFDRSVKMADVAGVGSVVNQKKHLLQLGDVIDKQNKAIKAKRDTIEAINANTAYSRGEKRMMTKALEVQEQQLYEQAINMFTHVGKQRREADKQAAAEAAAQ